MELLTLLIFAILLCVFLGVVCVDLYKAKQANINFNLKHCTVGFLMLAPAVVLSFLFIMLPILFSLGYAFTDFQLLTPDKVQFVGFKNLAEVFKDIFTGGELLLAIKNTAIFVVCVVPLQILLALGLALFCSRKVKGASIFKVCFFAPVVISLTVTSYLWLTILDPAETGLFNSLLKTFGLPPQDFLRDKNAAMLWIVLLSAWQGCGYQMLIFLSGLSNIRSDLYEAARLDGANSFKRFLNVTIPGLKSSVLYITITVFIGACRIMVQPMLMTGYQLHTATLSYYMYVQGYDYGFVGKSSAVALLMTIFIGLVTVIQKKVLQEK